MVLHTHEFGDVVAWLRAKGIRADELGGVLVVRRLDRLLTVAGATYRIPRADRELLRAARVAFESRFTDAGSVTPNPGLLSSVEGALERVCAGLADVGVRAQPFHGLGVIERDLILLGELELEGRSMRSATGAAIARP